MFSKLGGIFSGLPVRHVETADARLEIRRDESQAGNRKKDDSSENGPESIPWEDISYVSIASLKAFLESLIVTEESVPTPQPHMHEASNTLNQRATSAYQSVGRAVHDSNITAPTAQPAVQQSSVSDLQTSFTEADLARIRSYIADLIELERRGVTELGMLRSETFLDSLGAAIEEAKAKLGSL